MFEPTAYDQGHHAGLTNPARVCCPFDGRTRRGKSWWAGFMAGDIERCAIRRQQELENADFVLTQVRQAERWACGAVREEPSIRPSVEEVARAHAVFELAGMLDSEPSAGLPWYWAASQEPAPGSAGPSDRERKDRPAERLERLPGMHRWAETGKPCLDCGQGFWSTQPCPALIGPFPVEPPPGSPEAVKAAVEAVDRPCTCGLADVYGQPYNGSHLYGCEAVDWLPRETIVQTAERIARPRTGPHPESVNAKPADLATELADALEALRDATVFYMYTPNVDRFEAQRRIDAAQVLASETLRKAGRP